MTSMLAQEASSGPSEWTLAAILGAVLVVLVILALLSSRLRRRRLEGAHSRRRPLEGAPVRPSPVGGDAHAVSGNRSLMPLADLPEEFAGYRVERELGRGGMGVVYLATHIRLGRKAALKVLAPEVVSQEGFEERFIRESRLAASLDHPNIVPVYDAGEENGVLYLAMRYVEGTDLASVIGDTGALEPESALSIASQVADALDAAHAVGLVHRDVKPGNILVATQESSAGRQWVYLTDFGLTKHQESTTQITKSRMFMGTPTYVAPEQIRGDRLDGRADQYALACVLFEMIAGEPPFQRDLELAMLVAHLNDEPPLLSARRSGLPAALDAVSKRGMAKTPGERFATCSELVDAARVAVKSRQQPEATAFAEPPTPTLPEPPSGHT